MSTAPSDTASEKTTNVSDGGAPVPKRITNAQTVCNERNAKGKLCNGHLKQLRTAGEAAEVHLRGDDVLFKCQTCKTFYMGPPLGHVRDPHKQRRFVEAELTALLEAAGGTLPVIKKDTSRGVYVLVEEGTDHGSAAAKAPAKPAPAASPAKAVATTTAAPAQPAVTPPATKPGPKAGAAPNRQLNKRTTYSGFVDTGPVAGETFEQKVARLKNLAAAAKRRSEEGSGEAEPKTESPVPVAAETEVKAATVELPPVTEAPAQTVTATASPAPAAHKPTGEADRTLMKRSTYCGVVDTGPVPGETFEQKVQRLTKLAAAAKQRSEEGGE